MQEDIDDDENFIQEKSELFTLVMCIMLNNRDIFRYLLRRCGFLWNDIHLFLLTNYVLEAEWTDGLKILFTSPGVQQIFCSMNLYEKEHYLKFCDKSVCECLEDSAASSQLPYEFRYLMSFEPYNAYYLSIVAATEDLQFWDASTPDTSSKEVFFKTCLINFDEKAFTVL